MAKAAAKRVQDIGGRKPHDDRTLDLVDQIAATPAPVEDVKVEPAQSVKVKKRGRPPFEGEQKAAAEAKRRDDHRRHQKAYRDRQAAARAAAKAAEQPTTQHVEAITASPSADAAQSEIAALRTRVADLEAENARLRAAAKPAAKRKGCLTPDAVADALWIDTHGADMPDLLAGMAVALRVADIAIETARDASLGPFGPWGMDELATRLHDTRIVTQRMVRLIDQCIAGERPPSGWSVAKRLAESKAPPEERLEEALAGLEAVDPATLARPESLNHARRMIEIRLSGMRGGYTTPTSALDDSEVAARAVM